MSNINAMLEFQALKGNERKRYVIKRMLSRYRKTLTVISKLSLDELDVSLTMAFGEDTTCHITIYERRTAKNRSFNAYSFSDPDKNDRIFDHAIELAKGDNFLLVKESKSDIEF